MSLIITSSSQKEYDETTANHTGIENPASYQNFLSSPLIVEPNSEIAVVSIKCNRDQDQIVVEDDLGFFVYWGYERPDNAQDGGITPYEIDDPHTPLRIELNPGTYTVSRFLAMVKARLDAVVLKAFPEVKEIIVNELVGTDDKITIQFKQHGDGKGFTNHPVASEYKPFIDASTRRGYYDEGTHVVTEYTGNFAATDNGSATEVKITGYLASESTRVCDVIGTAHPVSRVTSKVVMKFNGSSAAGLADGYTLGFIRSQGGTIEGVQKNFSTVGGLMNAGKTELQQPQAGVNIPTKYGLGDGSADLPPFLFDIAFNWKNGQDGQAIHLVNDGDDDEIPEYRMEEVTTAMNPTNASLVANYYDRIEWEFSGETVSLYIGLTGKATREKMLDGTVLAFGSRFKALGQTCSSLYPKIGIHNNDATNPGVVDISTYNGHAKTHYYENNFWGYLTLDEEKDTKPPTSGPSGRMWTLLYRGIDYSSIYSDGTKRGVAGDLYVYQAELASSAGVGNLWSLLFPTKDDDDEISDYFFLSSQEDLGSLRLSSDVKYFLGFDGLEVQTEDATVSNGGADVLFESDAVAQRSFARTSMFIRMKNQALNSYNTNTRSISNILYSCPRFDAMGNTLGRLFFEPNERVYVKLNNISQEVMNSFDVDIVDVNEKVIENLLGNTIIVFHIRKSPK